MKKFVMFIMAALIAAGLIFVPSLVAQRDTPSSAAGPEGSGRPGMAGSGGAVFTVRTEEAQIRNLQAYIEVNGNILSAEQVTVVPEAAGKLVSMSAALGATVRKGELLAQVDPSRPGSQYSLSPVYAPISGLVVSNPAPVGSTVSTATALLTVAAAGSLEIEALIPEREIGQLRAGLPAEVRLEAFPGELFKAAVAKLSPVVDPASRTKRITLRFIREDRRVNSGMFARIKLNTRTYEKVISIPQEGVVENRGVPAVFVLSSLNGEGTGQVRLREVSLGVTVDGEVEIKSGLNAGDRVIVQGQQFLTDGSAVRVLGNR
ncbi:MAG: efflux RND transporter periplasmic adaptor subunit [Treponema sp.]|jgi:multidrug efflux pump subunit AcrA (membrane-fusion protein)|nr:efflux RND transporter periplasmic adaptor subunit [Treponema sp.]